MSKAILAVFATAIVGSALPVFIKIGTATIPPFTYTFLRFVLAGLCLLPFFLNDLPKIRRSLYKVVLLSLFPTANVVLFAIGVRLTSATIGQTLYAAAPLFVAIISVFILKEKITIIKSAGLIIGFIGVAIIINITSLFTNPALKSTLIGNVLIITAVICYVLYQVFSKPLQRQYKPLHLTMFFIMTTVITQAFLSVFESSRITVWTSHLSFQLISMLFYVAVFGTAVYYFLNQYTIKHSSPVIASLTLYLQPVFTFAWAHILLGEKLTFQFICGTILIFLGVTLTSGVFKKAR